MLETYEIKQLIDVRRFPGSNKFPHFNKENLESTLHENHIDYKHLEVLGGRRKASLDSENTVWRHPSFRAYADYMETSDFKSAIENLEDLASQLPSAMMCSEAVWWSCHRSMISDQLKANGWKVWHIMSLNTKTEHPYTKPAKVKNGKLTYK